MKPLNDYYEYTIASHFITALINNDYSGFTDQEESQFNDWNNTLLQIGGSFDLVDGEAFFAECDICGLFADCCLVRIHFHNSGVLA
jgi:hypothetical protein